MQSRRPKATTSRLPPPSKERAIPGPQLVALAFAALVVIGLLLYSPAFQGPFVFDDTGLPFHRTIREEPLSAWVAGVRPLLMVSYWLNRKFWGDDPFSYHLINALIHCLNSFMVLLVLYRLLEWAGWERAGALRGSVIGCLIFLVHPVQTEAVSYISGRSESLSALFQLLAYAVFLYRRKAAISWWESALVLMFLLAAVKTKENAVSVAGLLVLTDLFWPVPFSGAGLRRNWRLYVLLVPGAVAATVSVLWMLATAPSAGFSIQTATWYQYLLTEARALFVYIRLAVFPLGLSIDHDFPVSHTIFEHGAIGWVLLMGAILIAAFRFRRTFTLALFGLLFFLVELAPTSSVIPIADALVDRRVYLPLVGLILIGCDLLGRLKVQWKAQRWAARAAGAALVVLLGGWCYARNVEWGHPENIFASAAAQSTHNLRPYLHLTEVLVHEHSCEPAVPYLERAEQLFPDNFEVQAAWGWTLECMGRLEPAMQRLQLAARLRPQSSMIYEWIGLLYGEMRKPIDAGEALRHAVQLEPASVAAHEALALWYQAMGDLSAAEREHQQSVALDPHDESARAGLAQVRALLDARAAH
jgi:protein O-mannosyl-transferase